MSTTVPDVRTPTAGSLSIYLEDNDEIRAVVKAWETAPILQPTLPAPSDGNRGVYDAGAPPPPYSAKIRRILCNSGGAGAVLCGWMGRTL